MKHKQVDLVMVVKTLFYSCAQLVHISRLKLIIIPLYHNSCFIGICGSCSMNIGGQNTLACIW